jgi:RNA polymerase sigma factor (sigma-70 family)
MWQQYGNHEARNKLVESVLPWVVKCSKHYVKRGLLEMDEVAELAFIGALEAVDKYDPERGVLFTTYVVCRVKRAIRLYLAEDTSIIHRPNYLGRGGSTNGNCRNQSFVEKARAAGKICSLHVGDTLVHDPIDEKTVPRLEPDDVSTLHERVGRLSQRERFVVSHRIDGTKLREIGSLVGLTIERVNQIYHRAISKLRFAYKDSTVA